MWVKHKKNIKLKIWQRLLRWSVSCFESNYRFAKNPKWSFKSWPCSFSDPTGVYIIVFQKYYHHFKRALLHHKTFFFVQRAQWRKTSKNLVSVTQIESNQINWNETMHWCLFTLSSSQRQPFLHFTPKTFINLCMHINRITVNLHVVLLLKPTEFWIWISPKWGQKNVDFLLSVLDRSESQW